MSFESSAFLHPRALVIGGGFGGIAAALRLKAKGYQVTLVDRCPRLGGRAQVFERDGFRHDAGPTVITAPFLFDELFALFGLNRADYIEFLPLNPWYRFEFFNGDYFNYGGKVEDTVNEIRRFAPEDESGYLKLLVSSQRIFEIGFTQLADQPFHHLSTLLRQVPRLLCLRSHRSVWQLVCAHLKDERLRRVFSIQPLLLGGNPLTTTSIYSLIHYLECRDGVYFARGGIGAVVDALAGLLDRTGVTVRLETTVVSIRVHNGTAVGARLENGEELDADIVVSDADPLHVYTRLLPGAQQSLACRLKVARSRLSMGVFVLFFGSRKSYPHVAQHTVWLGQRYRGLLEDIFENRRLADDFSLYVHRPTATDPSFAPPGQDAFYALAPVPNLLADIDWAVEGPKLRERIIGSLERTLLPGVREHLVSDFYMTPKDFESRYLSVAGAGFSIAPLFRQSAWFRFHNRAEGPRNLYLVGAGTHPGAGLPGVLSSAKVLDRLVPIVPGARDFSVRP
ncbi:MAG TPA: phytoene desaturase family protein [Candidatus Competibacter sp.]|nr:phytoene desaturase family protein [Candidatus Competibacter sp.]